MTKVRTKTKTKVAVAIAAGAVIAAAGFAAVSSIKTDISYYKGYNIAGYMPGYLQRPGGNVPGYTPGYTPGYFPAKKDISVLNWLRSKFGN